MDTAVGDPLGGITDYLRGQLTLTADGELKDPTNIIKTLPAARAVYFQLRLQHLPRINLFAAIEGLIAGNPPYDPGELAKAGLGSTANFNDMTANSFFEKSGLAYWNLTNEVETLTKFEIYYPDQPNDSTLVRWAQIIDYEWDCIVKKWPSFYTQMNTLEGNLVKFGFSPTLRSDERDWRWKTIEPARFFVPDQTLSDIEQLTFFAVLSPFTVQYLYEVYTHLEGLSEKELNAQPWNREELSKLLLYRANTFAKTNGYDLFPDMMTLQQRIQNNDAVTSMIYTDALQLVSFFYKEYDGPFSHYMFDPVFDAASEFLFFADRQFKNISEATVIFTSSPYAMTIHSNLGVGHKMFSTSQQLMQTNCSIADMCRWGSTPMVRSTTPGAKDIDQIRFYPGVPINIGSAEFVNNQLAANIEQLVYAYGFSKNNLQSNIASSGDDPTFPDANNASVSDSQAKHKSFKEFGMPKNNIMHFYNQLDILFESMTIKMLRSKPGYPGYKEAKKWKDRCIARGVAKEVFEVGTSDDFEMPDHLKVKAARVAGDGSTLSRILGLDVLAPDVPAFSVKGQKEYLRQKVAVTLGREYVPAFISADESDEISGGASLAGVENMGMKAGESPIFSPNNEHRAHIAVHLALANQTIQSIQQQQLSAIDADKVFSVLVPHTGEHVQALTNNIYAKLFLDGIKKPWGQVVQYATLNRRNAAAEYQAAIKKQQEDQANTQAVLNDEQRKDIKLQGDEKRADYKVQSQVTRADDANKTRADIMRRKTDMDAQNDKLKISLDADNKALGSQPATPPLETQPLPVLRQSLANINGVTPAPADIEQ